MGAGCRCSSRRPGLQVFEIGENCQQYAAASLIGVEAPGDLAYFDSDACGGTFQTEVLYNWLDAGELVTSTSGWRKRLQLEDKVVFFYGGNIGVAQDLDNLVRLASSLQNWDDIFFLLMGSGSEATRLKAKIENLDLQNIRLYPPVPQDEYMKCLSEFDVGVISLDRRWSRTISPGNFSDTFCVESQSWPVFVPATICSIYCKVPTQELHARTELTKACAQLRCYWQRMLQRENAWAGTLVALVARCFPVRSAAQQILSHFPLAASTLRVAAQDLPENHSPTRCI